MLVCLRGRRGEAPANVGAAVRADPRRRIKVPAVLDRAAGAAESWGHVTGDTALDVEYHITLCAAA